MRVYVDTSAFLALIDADDNYHLPAKRTWFDLLDQRCALFTSNYVLIETHALLQNRLGMEAVRAFHDNVYPILHVKWVGKESHEMGVAAVLTSNRRSLSLVDCLSFITMRHHHIDAAFTFDRHFAEQGFRCLPAQRPDESNLIHKNQNRA